MRRLCATVLVMESLVVVFAVPVAVTVAHTPPRSAYLAGGVLATVAIALAAVVGRRGPRWALAAGSLLQACMIATGLVVTAMYALGALFAALWAIAIWLGLRYRDVPGQ